MSNTHPKMPVNAAINRLRGVVGDPERPGRLDALVEGDPYQTWRALLDCGHDVVVQEYAVAKLGALPTLEHMLWCALSLGGGTLITAARDLARCGFDAAFETARWNQAERLVVRASIWPLEGCPSHAAPLIEVWEDARYWMGWEYGWTAKVRIRNKKGAHSICKTGMFRQMPPMGDIPDILRVLENLARYLELPMVNAFGVKRPVRVEEVRCDA